MTQTLHVEFETHEGALLRLIGLIERRGFDIHSVDLPAASAGRMNVGFGVIARNLSSDIGILQRQIHRLTGVCRVFGDVDGTDKRVGGQHG